ncbi:MAG TPA: hypothetical protein VMN57_00870 [Anaerolineales bacterium]|nr:hypothetical protein [Anaerolineales bacterium]
MTWNSFEKTRRVSDTKRLWAAWSAVLCLAAALSACRAPDPPALPTASPTPTATTFHAPDLEPVFNDRRLHPSQATSVELTAVRHPSFAALPEPNDFISAVYAAGAEFAGRVSIFFYLRPEDFDAAWPLLLDLIPTPKEVTGVGELAAVNHSDMAFIRCTALVHIKLVNTAPVDLRTYAETLDAQLIPLICKN